MTKCPNSHLRDRRLRRRIPGLGGDNEQRECQGNGCEVGLTPKMTGLLFEMKG